MRDRQCALRRSEIYPEFTPKSLTGDIRCPPARGLPPRRACARVNQQRRSHSDANTEALLQSRKLPPQSLSEIQAAEPQRNQSHARPSYVGPGTQSCAASPGTLSLAVSEALGSPPFSFRRRDFTYAVQGLLVRSSLRSTLSRCGEDKGVKHRISTLTRLLLLK